MHFNLTLLFSSYKIHTISNKNNIWVILEIPVIDKTDATPLIPTIFIT